MPPPTEHRRRRAVHESGEAACEQEGVVRDGALGLNYAPESVLWEPALRPHFKPAEMVQYDWMHVLLVQRLFQLEVTLALGRLSRRGFSYETVHIFLKLVT